MYAKKGNVQLTLVNPGEADKFSQSGYDVYDDNDKIIKPAQGKQVSWSEYQKVLDQLKAKGGGKPDARVKELETELDKAYAKISELEKQLLELQDLPDSLD